MKTHNYRYLYVCIRTRQNKILKKGNEMHLYTHQASSILPQQLAVMMMMMMKMTMQPPLKLTSAREGIRKKLDPKLIKYMLRGKVSCTR